MANLDIRSMMLNNGLRQFMVAKELGVSEFTLSRWLRDDLSPTKKTEIVEAINRLVAKQA